MKKFFKTVYSHLAILLIILSVGFLSSFLLTDFYNNNNAYYQAEIIVEDIDEFDTNKLTDYQTLNSIK